MVTGTAEPPLPRNALNTTDDTDRSPWREGSSSLGASMLFTAMDSVVRISAHSCTLFYPRFPCIPR